MRVPDTWKKICTERERERERERRKIENGILFVIGKNQSKSQNQKGIFYFDFWRSLTCMRAFEIWGGMLFLQLCVLAKQRGWWKVET
jgi:hypothetical protein